MIASRFRVTFSASFHRLAFNTNRLFSTHTENIKQRIPKRIPKEPLGEAAIPSSLYKVRAYNTAESYDIGKWKDLLSKEGSQEDSKSDCKILSLFSKDILHVSVGQHGDAFFFGSGSIVFWNTTEAVEKSILQDIKIVEVNPNENIELEEMDFKQSSNGHSGIQSEVIVLSSLDNSRDKLAFSNGLGSSVKLGSVESQLEKHIQSVRHIPAMLLQGKKLPLRRSTVLQKLGELLNLRGNLNLYSELTEIPDLYWSDAHLAELYHQISVCLDIRLRVNILNKKLDYANEMAQVLRNHLSEQHSLKLEWFIIILIAVEVVFEFFHYYRSAIEEEKK